MYYILEIKKFISFLLPYEVKRIINKIYHQYQKGIKLGRGTYVSNLKCDGSNKIGSFCEVTASEMGYASYIADRCKMTYTKIGKFSTIGNEVRTCIGNHSLSNVSIHPAFYSLNGNSIKSFIDKQIFDEHTFINKSSFVCIIGNDVWIGDNVIIFDGIKIGDGAVIGAGSIITKDVKPYTIVHGVPGKFKRNRFSKNNIKYLLNLKWWDKDIKWIKNNAKHFNDLEKLKKIIRKKNKKSDIGNSN
tara:strand:+ start:6802 stop:7536 length:735 start_codon:yes stop_codon:yes gene_type:complete